jgi:hypothetical protein
MKMNMNQLQECFRGSRTLNQMKADITLFVHMFVSPLDDEVKKLGKFLALSIIDVSDDYSIEIGTNKRSLSLWAVGKKKGITHSFSIDEGTEIPARYVRDLWQTLPRVLEELIILFPKLQQTVDFYSNAAK